jgi:hypothetical protein
MHLNWYFNGEILGKLKAHFYILECTSIEREKIQKMFDNLDENLKQDYYDKDQHHLCLSDLISIAWAMSTCKH